MPDYSKLHKEMAHGRSLLESHKNSVHTHSSFGRWVDRVSALLEELSPGTGVSLEWMGLGISPLVGDGGYYDDAFTWSKFANIVQQRMSWLGQVPQRMVVLEKVMPDQVQAQALATGAKEVRVEAKGPTIVAPSRIEELAQLTAANFDFTKLVRLCEELNICFAAECYLATSMLTRALLDHVPPIFGFQSFKEAASNYSGGRSFKASLQNLENSSRKIADQHLHGPIRQSEVLPTAQQVNCSSDLDVMLGEIVRINKPASKSA